jgi:hypothetical protein
MSGFVGRLRASLGLDTAQFDAGMAGAQARARTGFAGAFAGIGRMITPITAGLAAAAASAYGIAAPALRAAAAIDEAAKAARRVDGSLAGWEGLRLSASEAGVEISALSAQIQNLNTRLAAPNPQTATALRQLGLDAATLRGLDVDDRLATIADAVARLGLDAGQTGAALRALGIEDLRMVGLIMAGGAGIRAASRDIRDYGLAVADIDAARIEAANDQIARLSLVSRYFGQQMALAVVPAMGAFAQAMTESLRTGGLLRGMIDGIAGAIGAVTGYFRDVGTVLSTLVGGVWDWVRSLFGAQGQLAGVGQTFLELGRIAGRVISYITGASLIGWAADLIRGAGDGGTALKLLGDVAAGVWTGIVEGAGGIPAGLRAYWHTVRADFLWMVRGLVTTWADFLRGFRDSLPGVSAFDGIRDGMTGAYESALQTMTSLGQAAHAATAAAAEAGDQWSSATSFEAARTALTALNEAVERGAQATSGAAATTREFNGTLDATPGAAGGAAAGVRQVADAASELQSQIKSGADAVTSLFSAITGGSGGVRQALARILQQIAEAQFRMAILNASSGASGGGFLGFLGRLLLPRNARGTDSWRGGLTMVGEEGPELVSIPTGARIASATNTASMLGRAAAPQPVDVRVFVDQDGNWQAAVERISSASATRAVSGYDRHIMPGRVRGITANPRRG